jgi:hypothetical protein
MAASMGTETVDLLARFNENLRWAKAHSSELRRHAGRYVVVSEDKIIFHSPSKNVAESKAKAVPGAYVTLVTPEQWAWIL